MASPTEPTNVSKVLRAVEHCLRGINRAAGYRTDGIVVDRGRDPTVISADKDKVDQYRKLMAAAGILPGSERDTGQRVGGVRRWEYTYLIMCLRELTAADRQAGKRLDDLAEEMLDDLHVALDPDAKIKAAAAQIGFASLSCINHHIVETRTDQGINWPTVRFGAVVQFLYDRPIVPAGDPAGV